MKAIEALEIVNREGTDNSEYGIFKDWKHRFFHGYSLLSMDEFIRDLFGQSCEVMESDPYECWNTESVLYVYYNGTHDFSCLEEKPILTIQDHESECMIDLFRLE